MTEFLLKEKWLTTVYMRCSHVTHNLYAVHTPYTRRTYAVHTAYIRRTYAVHTPYIRRMNGVQIMGHVTSFLARFDARGGKLHVFGSLANFVKFSSFFKILVFKIVCASVNNA